MTEPIHIISLGAGVQSSTMALMAAKGEITPMPVAAIFADTQAEPKSVYTWLDWLEKQLPFPVHRVTAGSLLNEIARKRPRGSFRVVDIPAFVVNGGKVDGLINRSCTRDYKINPIQKQVRALCGLTRKKSPDYPVAIQWIGISLDEVSRMKEGREPWIENRWPLIELRMSRQNCLKWMRQNGFPEPAKSACTFCPYHSDSAWRSLNAEEMAQAIEVDERLRKYPATEYRTKGVLYLHRSGRPLSEVDFSTEEERGQLNMFNNECEGMCGV